MEKYNIYVVSDSLGETAEKVALAAIEQFEDVNYKLIKVPYVTQSDQILDVVSEAKKNKSIILFTLVIKDLRKLLINECEKNRILKLDDNYFKRVEAVEFAVKYDDGKDVRGIKKADIVILGISRTSKTPLSFL